MANSARYQVQVGGFLTEGFDAASDADAALIIADICTGRESVSNLPLDRDPTPEEQGKDPAAVAMGKKGGKARAGAMTPEQRMDRSRP
jgi:hypothetical protein